MMTYAPEHEPLSRKQEFCVKVLSRLPGESALQFYVDHVIPVEGRFAFIQGLLALGANSTDLRMNDKVSGVIARFNRERVANFQPDGYSE